MPIRHRYARVQGRTPAPYSTALMATGACTHAEYGEMLEEKMDAMHLSGVALMSGQVAEDVLRPFHTRARANAKRLRPA